MLPFFLKNGAESRRDVKPCGEGLACEPRGCVAYVTSLLGDRIRARGARGYLLRVFQHGVPECEGIPQRVERHDRHAH